MNLNMEDYSSYSGSSDDQEVYHKVPVSLNLSERKLEKASKRKNPMTLSMADNEVDTCRKSNDNGVKRQKKHKQTHTCNSDYETTTVKDEADQTDDYASVKAELSTLTFEELKKLKEKLGLKVFNQVMYGNTRKDDSVKKVFKRENKNRPKEMSSKRPVPRFRNDVAGTKTKMTRDPRFDDLSGEYNEHYFNKSYSFLDDIKSREKQKIQKKLKKEKNPERKKELQFLLNRMKQQEKSVDQKVKQKEIEKEWKRKEQGLVKEGKSPFYLKKSERRKLELAEKYKELHKSGKVDKYLGKKRKKNAQKEKKKLPEQTLPYS